MKSMLSLSCERFSARKFTAEPVSQEDLEYIMKCVRMAPSACNKQPWRWLVVRSEAAKKQLHIVGLMNVKENWVRKYDNYPHGAIDVAIAAEHLCLAATDRGLGTCWVCAFNPAKFNEYFGREDFEPVVIIPIGHIADDCPRAEKVRKDMSEIMEEV